MYFARRRSVDTVRNQDGYTSGLDPLLPGPGHQRQCWRDCHLRHDFRADVRHWRRGVGHAQGPSQADPPDPVDVGEHGNDPFAHCGHLHAGEFEAECSQDVILLHRALAVVEQPGLEVVLGEAFWLAADLVVGLSAPERTRNPVAPA